MTHVTLNNVITVTVTSTDAQLLDDVAAALPDDDAPFVGPEYDGPRRITADDDAELSDGEERLTSRVAFVAGDVTVEADDGTKTTYNGGDEAAALYDDLTALSLSSDATVEHYRSPTGAVTVDDVQAWHEENVATGEDGNYECGCTSGWDPSGHTIESF